MIWFKIVLADKGKTAVICKENFLWKLCKSSPKVKLVQDGGICDAERVALRLKTAPQ